MINKDKTHRLMIQISINQYKWLLKKSNQLEISISQLVRWLLNKKIKDVNDITILNKEPKKAIEHEQISDEDWIKQLEEISKPLKKKPTNDLPF